MLGAVESGLFTSKVSADMRGQPTKIDAIEDTEKKAPEPRGYQRPTDHGALRFASLEQPHTRVAPQYRAPACAPPVYRRKHHHVRCNKLLQRKLMCARALTATGCRRQASGS
uniref:Uncharacterized protein n=1 Tax=Peronospora matthiolae TaxID=2874970 RepID=A0AAV1VLT7_9STRA